MLVEAGNKVVDTVCNEIESAFSMETAFTMFLGSQKKTPLNPEKIHLLVARMLKKSKTTRLRSRRVDL